MLHIKLFPAEYGDCIILSIGKESQYNILIDGGLSKTYHKYIKAEIQHIKELGQKIGLMVCTHMDNDHICGLIQVLKGTNFNFIENVWYNGFLQIVNSRFYSQKENIFTEKDNKILDEIISQGMLLDVDQEVGINEGMSLGVLIEERRIPLNSAERNKQIEKELYNIDEDSEIDIRLQKQNLSIDRVLAELIRWEMEGAHHMREEGFPDLKEILDYENNRRRILGVKFQIMDKNDQVLFEDIPNPTIEQQRGGYYSFVLGQTLDIARFKINKSNSEKMKEYRKKWKAIDTQIEDGTFNESTVREEYRKAIMEEMEKIDERRKGLQEELDSLDGKEGAPFAFETDDDLKERQASYVDYCKKVDISEKSLYDIVNHFVGQAMYEFLK